jgi:hypothetical protein
MGGAAKNPVGWLATRWRNVSVGVALVLLPFGGHAQPSKESPRILTKVSQIRSLSVAEAARKYPIQLKAVITFVAAESSVTFLQDDTAGIYLFGQSDPRLIPGRMVELTGNTTPGEYAPSIENATVHYLGQGPLPLAPLKSMDRLLSGAEDSQWVAVQGVVHSANVEDRLPPDMQKTTPHLVLQIAADGHQFKARIRQFQQGEDYSRLVGATVTIRGVCGTLFNTKRQLTGVQLFVPSVEQMTVDVPAPSDRYAAPVAPISSVLQFHPGDVSDGRIHVRGVVTFRKPGFGLVAQDETGGVVIETPRTTDVSPGDLVDAIGFPAAGSFVPVLQDSDYRKIGKAAVPPPVDINNCTNPLRGNSVVPTIPGNTPILGNQRALARS